MTTIELEYLRKWVGSVQLVKDPLGDFLARALGSASQPLRLGNPAIKRSSIRAAPPSGEQATSAADWSWTFEPDSVDLFRSSALTFNAHRIHYDRDYATRQELYPGLVVHAPLLVTLLLDLLAREPPTAPLNAVRFRAVRPTLDMSPVHSRGKRDGRHVNLWTANMDNFIGLSALAALGQPT
jgi:3-methylfumaryl-CoA hydratase